MLSLFELPRNCRLLSKPHTMQITDYRTGFSKYSKSGSPIISRFRVFLREIVVLYKDIFVCMAKKLSITVFNLLCRFL